MSVTLSAQPLPACPLGEHFVNPQFNLVMLLSLYFISRSIRGSTFSWTIDGVAAVVLLFTTHHRCAIISNMSNELCSNKEDFYLFFVSSLASWIAATVLETRTCLHTAKKMNALFSGAQPVCARNLISALPVVLLALNSVVVMVLFCFDVSETVRDNATDSWLYVHHTLASVAKVFSTACQGVYLILGVCRYRPTIDGYFLIRMTFINAVTLVHSSCLMSMGGLSVFRWYLLIVDLCFRLLLCLWYGYSYKCGRNAGELKWPTQCTEVDPTRSELVCAQPDSVYNSPRGELLSTQLQPHRINNSTSANAELVVGCG